MLHKRFTMMSFFLAVLLVMHGLIVCPFAHTHQDSKDGFALKGGRKVLMIKKLSEIAKAGGKNDQAGAISGIISGATPRDHGKSEEKRDFNGILCRLGAGVKMDSTTHHRGSKKLSEAGFVAFNTDYYGPKHHPPKHN